MIERFEDDKMTLRDSKLFTYLLKLVEMRVVDVDKVSSKNQCKSNIALQLLVLHCVDLCASFICSIS